MSLARSKPPGSLGNLQKWLTEWAETEGVTAGRLLRRVAVLVVAGMLDQVRDEDGRHRFVAKGGSALELRFGARARTSKDFDAVYRGALDDALAELEGAVTEPWNDPPGRAPRRDRGPTPAPARPTRPRPGGGRRRRRWVPVVSARTMNF